MNLIDRIEQALSENKSSTKTYATKERAEKTATKLWGDFNRIYGSDIPGEFVTVYVPSTNRWTPVFNLTNWLGRFNNGGVYVGFFATKGFFTI